MAVQTYTYSTTLTVINCGVCRIPFAIPDDLYAARLNDGQWFYCPNGHRVHETQNAKLTRQLAYQRDRAAALAAERDQAKASLRTTKGVVTKLRNHAAAGECPFCGAHVYQLSRHMARKHPDEPARSEASE